ncbi:type VI secretion system baseplate subunit TssF [Pseudomonas sp. 39004]|uniref:type VI secretion system baseplate subunit TssF n=1 Tax=Pseudomonas sp. 39004 TaxID=2967213 RepID=UPI002363F91C|nr:type VI secretion system baseplate subunit TssF [Pseudomonas sp. 39004]MDD1962658.1 type VI secretion system baseplate subunit TssF [Pseudomonas sp. 39004]
MKFKDWFTRELQTLRELGDDFVEDEPRLAPFLGRTASDPQSEYVLEHFAFLTARLVMKLEDHLPELTHPLLQLLYPNVLRPLPSMTVMQFQPVDHALSETQVLAKGTPVFSQPVEGVSCEFRTCAELAIAPLEIRSITTQPSAEAPVVRIDLGALSEQPLRRMKCDQLQFHLAGGHRNALHLYQWLAQHLDKLYLHIGQHRFALPPSVTFVGFEVDEALLPSAGEQMDGYRILQEFFCFPDRFHGFRIEGLGAYWPDEAAEQIQLELRFNAPLPPDLQIDQTTILLNCVPAINLFTCKAKPIPLNEKVSHPLINVGRQGSDKDEIFSVDRVSSQRQKSKDHVQEFTLFESLHRNFPLGERVPTRYYQLDIEQEPVNDTVQHKIRVVHHNLAPYLGDQEELSIDLTCSNGVLAQQLKVGEIDLTTQDTPSFVTYRNLTPPTRSYPPMLQSGGQGERHWALISHLALNNLSLSSPAALASVLRVYDFVGAHDLPQARRTAQRLGAIKEVHSEPYDWLIKGLPVRGMRTTLHIDPDGLECWGEVQLFGNVLSHFMASYASSNSFHQLQIVNTANATRQLWPARTGRQPVM